MDFLEEIECESNKYKNLKEKITKATETYVKILHKYDVSRIIDFLVSYHGSDKFDSIEYPGRLDYTEDPKNFVNEFTVTYGKDKKVPLREFVLNQIQDSQKRYQVGVISMDYSFSFFGEESDHYNLYIYDTQQKNLCIFDTGGFSPEENHIYGVLEEIFTKAKIDYHKFDFQVGNRHFLDQNIFCHTWSLFIVDTVVRLGLEKGISLLYSIEKKYKDESWMFLVLIKRFVNHLFQIDVFTKAEKKRFYKNRFYFSKVYIEYCLFGTQNINDYKNIELDLKNSPTITPKSKSLGDKNSSAKNSSAKNSSAKNSSAKKSSAKKSSAKKSSAKKSSAKKSSAKKSSAKKSSAKNSSGK